MSDQDRKYSLLIRPGWIVLALTLCTLASGSALAESLAQQVSGKVEIGRGEPPTWQALRAGDSIASNDRIRTGADGRVEITMAAGTLRVHENSMLRLPPPAAEADRVELEQGHSLFDVMRRAGRRFEVHTPTVVVSVKGTRFGVDASGEIGEVSVFRGVVGVRDAGLHDAIETLVREGFTASGGVGMPIELEVAPEGDPWIRWQDFQHQIGERREAPVRLNEVDRARATLHRATNADVLQKAAERKPEVADRLRKLERDQAKRERHGEKPGAIADTNDEERDGPGADGETAMPAAPMMGEDDPRAHKRKLLREMIQNGDNRMQEQEIQELAKERMAQMIQAQIQQKMQAMTVMPIPDSSGETQNLDGTGLELSFLSSLDPSELETIVETYFDTRTTFVNDPDFSSSTSGDFLRQLEQELIANGIDPTVANDLITRMNGS